MTEKRIADYQGINCVTFKTGLSTEIRVVYESDGAPRYCASDIALCIGYPTPNRVIERFGEAVKHKLFVPWVSETRRGRSMATCLTTEGAITFTKRFAKSDTFINWFCQEVVPQAEEVGREIGYHYEEPTPERGSATGLGIAERLDELIHQMSLIRQELANS